jgi:hypothetical protein
MDHLWIALLTHGIFNFAFEFGEYRLSISYKRLHTFRKEDFYLASSVPCPAHTSG